MRYILLLLTASSCASIYMPNTHNTPMFRESGEFQGSVYAAAGVDLQAAYAVTDHVALMGNYSHLSSKETDQELQSPDYTRKNSFWEGGLGVFEATKKTRYELFAGYGKGTGTSASQYYFFYPDFGQQKIVATGNYSRIFIQPAIGTNNRKFNVTFAPRFSLVEFSDFTSSGITHEPDEKPQLFIEPALCSKFTIVGNLEGVLQVGITVPTKSDVYFEYESFQASVGIQLHLGNRMRTRVY